MIYEVPNSHYWTDLEMMINYFTVVPEFNRDYIITGLRNMQTLGYSVTKHRPLKSGKRSQQQTTAKVRKPKRPAHV